MERKLAWSLGHTLVLAGIVLFIVLMSGGVINWPLVKGDPSSRVLTWWVIAGLLVLSLAVIGHGIVGRPLGFLIDDRNRMSLSRLQLLAWTILVLAGFYTIVLWNARNGNSNPLNVGVPQELWWLMGISTTSLVGSPLIKGIKKSTPNKSSSDFDSNKEEYLERRGEKFTTVAANSATSATPAATPASDTTSTPVGATTTTTATTTSTAAEEAVKKEEAKKAIVAVGQEVFFELPDMASPADLFGGEETGNVHVLDVGKVQLFYFTVILLITYSLSLLTILGSDLPPGQLDFPPLDEGMIALLGISHAGYLGFKAAPHSPTQEPQQ